MRLLKGVYAYVGRLPDGCIQCMQGVKMVVFVTGLCDDSCFYCPVSPERLYHDVSYVDEEPLASLDDLVQEAYAVGAEGASVTGGDPLARPGRTIRVIRVLKEVFGPDFHVHLYTSGRHLTREVLSSLENAGLDEIRLHPTQPWLWERVEKVVQWADRLRVGVEVPVLPDRAEELWRRILWLDRIGVEFINLNELEASVRNIENLRVHGYRVSRSAPVVEGSEAAALELVRRAAREGLHISVHYCPASYKDSVQMRLRLIRKALRLAAPYERVTPEGMLEYLESNSPRALGLAEKGYGRAAGGVALLHPTLAASVKGVLRRRYPVRGDVRLPLEVERVS